MLLFVVRHGDPIYRPDSLTPKGHLQAKALAKRFAINGLDRIYSSPLIRARQTAQPTCEILGKELKIEPWTSENLAEADFFVQNRKNDGRRGWVFHQPTTNLKNDNTVNLTMNNWFEAEGLQCYEEQNKFFRLGYERIKRDSDEFIARHGYKREGAVYKITNPNDERIAVFCHQGFGVTWLSHLFNIPPHIFWSTFDLSHSGVTVIQFENYESGYTTPKCLCLSDLSHILNDDLPYEYNNTIKL